MSVSIHSETSKDEIDQEEVELEDIVWNLMSRTGLLSQIQGQISKFIEDNGNVSGGNIIPERADGRILGLIFEYLQWVGMKQTNSVLLSESPIEIDLTTYESRDAGDPHYHPELCRLLEDAHVSEEDKGSPTRSHNYSKDDFEDSKLTSASMQQSVNSSKCEVKDSTRKDEVDSAVVQGVEATPKNASSNPLIGIQDNQDQSEDIEIPSFASTPRKSSSSSLVNEDKEDDMLINFNSPVVKDQARPYVTLRQKIDLNVMADPFQSPVGNSNTEIGKMSAAANFPVGSEDKTDFDEASKLVEETSLNIQPEDDRSESKVNANFTKSIELQDKVSNSVKNDQQGVADEERKDSLKAASQASGDADSTSDFMETLTIEEDTQDASIASDSRGMSSCEYAVSLK